MHNISMTKKNKTTAHHLSTNSFFLERSFCLVKLLLAAEWKNKGDPSTGFPSMELVTWCFRSWTFKKPTDFNMMVSALHIWLSRKGEKRVNIFVYTEHCWGKNILKQMNKYIRFLAGSDGRLWLGLEPYIGSIPREIQKEAIMDHTACIH